MPATATTCSDRTRGPPVFAAVLEDKIAARSPTCRHPSASSVLGEPEQKLADLDPDDRDQRAPYQSQGCALRRSSAPAQAAAYRPLSFARRRHTAQPKGDVSRVDIDQAARSIAALFVHRHRLRPEQARTAQGRLTHRSPPSSGPRCCSRRPPPAPPRSAQDAPRVEHRHVHRPLRRSAAASSIAKAWVIVGKRARTEHLLLGDVQAKVDGAKALTRWRHGGAEGYRRHALPASPDRRE